MSTPLRRAGTLCTEGHEMMWESMLYSEDTCAFLRPRRDDIACVQKTYIFVACRIWMKHPQVECNSDSNLQTEPQMATPQVRRPQYARLDVNCLRCKFLCSRRKYRTWIRLFCVNIHTVLHSNSILNGLDLYLPNHNTNQ